MFIFGLGYTASRIAEAQAILADGAGKVAEGMPAKLTANTGLQSSLRQLISQQTPASLACALRAMASRQDSTSFLQTVNYPIVVIHGLDDALIPVERARQMKSLVKNGSLVELEGVGHMPMMESPHKTAQALEILYK